MMKCLLACFLAGILLIFPAMPSRAGAEEADEALAAETEAEESEMAFEAEVPEEAADRDVTDGTTEEPVNIPDEPAGEPVTITESDSASVLSLGLPDSDDLFAGYVEQVFGMEIFYGNGEFSDTSSVGLRPTPSPQGEGFATSAYGLIALDRQMTVLSELLLERFGQVADGSLSYTVFDLEALLPDVFEISYTAEELGVSGLIDGDKISEEARLAVNGKLTMAMNVLISEAPYELYWFDKTVGYRWNNTYKADSAGTGRLYVSKIGFCVIADFSRSGNTDTYYTDTAKTGAARTAVANALTVVANHAQETDYQKLTSYKNYICDAVNYNSAAASAGTYGNPWQLIWVFDGDPSTNVVCEGYAKAFQYLASKSVWHDPGFSCIAPGGYMVTTNGSPGNHMWNIVTLNGENYMADITNSDAGSAGSNGRLFLTGTGQGTGTAEDPYVFRLGSSYSISYWYKMDSPTSVYSEELVLSTGDFDPSADDHNWDGGTVTKTQTYTEDGEILYHCATCGAVKTETLPAQPLSVMRSISLSELIGVNLYIPVTGPFGEATADFKLNFAAGDGPTETVTLKTLGLRTLADGNTYYYARLAELPAKQMSDVVHVTLLNGSTVVLFADYSVKSYCEAVIGDPESPEELVAVCRAALDYGTYAQAYFDYNLDDPANGGTPLTTLTAVPEFPYENGQLSGVTMRRSLSLKSQVAVNCYFAAEGEESSAAGSRDVPALENRVLQQGSVTLSQDSFSVDVGDTGAEWTVTWSEAMNAWRVQIYGFPARKLGGQVTVTVRTGAGSASGAGVTTASWTFSPLTYAYLYQDSETMSDVLRALYGYYKATAAYFR